MHPGPQRGAFVLVLLLATLVHAEPMRRFALVIGNDTGGAGTQPLRYAREDARKMHDLMARLGGVRPEDAQLLLNQEARDVLTGLTELEGRIKAAQAQGERTALIVFYSGHAKEEALRLGDSRLPFETLKRRLADASADIRIAILDSCRSGTLTRAKGARRAPAFSIDSGTSREARGLVILTSSTADEDSQESDMLGGSYFSHHLLSGLLGDADRSGDGRVTLFEAYSHAYARTVADTAASGAGPQHPTFSYDLAGNGDLVLTELRASEGLVVPGNAPAGPYYFVDSSGLVVAELDKAHGVERRVALAPGTYRVKRRLEDRLRTGEVTVRRGQETVLEESRLRDAPFSDDPVKGARTQGSFWVVGAMGGMQSFFDGTVRDTLFLPSALLGVEASLHDYFRQDWVWSFDLAVGGREATLALPTLAGLNYRYSVFCLGTSLTAEWPWGNWTPFAGARLTYVVLGRKFKDAAYPDQQYAAFSPGLVGGLRYRLLSKLHVAGHGRIHSLIYNVERPQRSLGYWELSALVAYEL
ncbi:caspase family protein [Stigmatella aurantiaca]|uniref:ActD n=1 Tax=Stigmatella aurantiaca (strain DW4/3-1) TaxID=378806 RepID=Q08XS8_STIAD|nr:caspase family protein [Stigmatella aurantiaca]ADO73440.1 ActD-like protein [Stigmatella aurantiaca DW4/3-1]EAU65276.1 ActD [Stigmatella aurantiaca DW4/3-1]